MQESDERLDLTPNQRAIRGRLPSFIPSFQRIPKARLLDRIASILRVLPAEIFYIVLTYLNIECALYIEAVGLGDKLVDCIRSYPTQIAAAWTVNQSDMSGPPLYIKVIEPSHLKKVRSFAPFLSACSQSNLFRNPLFTKVQIDALSTSHSNFNPRYPVVGMCLHNTFTYYLFALDDNIHRTTPSMFANTSHVKYIFDVAGGRIVGTQWSPDGELLAILSKPNAAYNPFPSTIIITLAYYNPSTGIVREYSLSSVSRDTIETSFRFASPRVWCDDSAMYLADGPAKRFRKMVVHKDRGEIEQLTLCSTKGIDDFLDDLEAQVHLPRSSDEKRTQLASMSASHHYPKFVVTFLVVCFDHDQSHHNSILFYNILKDECLKRVDLPGYLRSMCITRERTVYYTELPVAYIFYEKLRKHPSAFVCTQEVWIQRKEDAAFVHGSVHVTEHSEYTTRCITREAETGMVHRPDRTYSLANSVPPSADSHRHLNSVGFDRCLQACDDYALVWLTTHGNLHDLVKINFYTDSCEIVSGGLHTSRTRSLTTMSADGFLTMSETNNFWCKPQIHYCAYLPCSASPQFFNCYTKVYFENPMPLRKTYSGPTFVFPVKIKKPSQ